MSTRFRTRQLALLGLNANAARPLPGEAAALPAFFAGWLTSELAPHLLAATAADAATHLAARRSRSDVLGLALATVNAAALVAQMTGGGEARRQVEDALVSGLGPDYAAALTRPPAAVELATPWRELVNPFQMRHPDVVIQRHQPYYQGGRRFHADVYHHRDRPSGAPVLFQVHGGGWVIGTKEQQALPLMHRMAARGWVCVSVNYPLSPRARWPEHLIALKRALAWTRANVADYGGDPDFIAATGGSAGGHLSAMLAITAHDRGLQPGFEDADTSVQACVPHYGVYDFTAESGLKFTQARLDSLLRRVVMSPDAVYPDDFRAASPYYRLDEVPTGDIPPFLVVHGSNDTLVPVPEARRFVQRLRAVSTEPVAYAEITGGQHAFDLFPSIRSAHVVRGVERFLDWAHATRFSRAADRESVPRPA
jgi:acetyl esterase/lipase